MHNPGGAIPDGYGLFHIEDALYGTHLFLPGNVLAIAGTVSRVGTASARAPTPKIIVLLARDIEGDCWNVLTGTRLTGEQPPNPMRSSEFDEWLNKHLTELQQSDS
jgi:hypothetical protein